MTVPPCFWMSAYRSRYAVSSRRQPGVKALGKKASTTGPLSTREDSASSAPSTSLTLKSGAISPTAGWAARREVTRIETMVTLSSLLAQAPPPSLRPSAPGRNEADCPN